MNNAKKLKKAIRNDLVDGIEEEIKNAKSEEMTEDLMGSFDSKDDSEDEIESLSPSNLLNKDFLIARSNLKKLNKRGMIAFDNIVKKIKAGEMPRSVEDVCNLIKTLVSTNKEMMNLHEVKARIADGNKGGKKGGDDEGEASVDGEGNLSTDSSTLSKMVNKMIKKSEEQKTGEQPIKKKKKKIRTEE